VKALVIDDSPTMRTVLSRIVSEVGLDVVEAGDGAEALAYVDEMIEAGTVPELALVDWNMPVMDGITFVSRVRARRAAARRMTMVMVTSQSEQSQIVRALAAGAHEYLVKPFSADGLVDKLRSLGLVPREAAVP
jgi:two-component system chemotaxis response regulator CheY